MRIENCFYIHELHIMNIKLRLFEDKQLNIKLSKSLIQTNDSICLQLYPANLHKTVSSWLKLVLSGWCWAYLLLHSVLVFFCQQSTMSLFTLKARAWSCGALFETYPWVNQMVRLSI